MRDLYVGDQSGVTAKKLDFFSVSMGCVWMSRTGSAGKRLGSVG